MRYPKTVLLSKWFDFAPNGGIGSAEKNADSVLKRFPCYRRIERLVNNLYARDRAGRELCLRPPGDDTGIEYEIRVDLDASAVFVQSESGGESEYLVERLRAILDEERKGMVEVSDVGEASDLPFPLEDVRVRMTERDGPSENLMVKAAELISDGGKDSYVELAVECLLKVEEERND